MESNEDRGVTATRDDGGSVEVRNVPKTRADTDASVTATNDNGQKLEVRDVSRSTTDVNPLNPLGEEEILVKTREGVEFYHMGVLRKGGEEPFRMAVSMARAAHQFVVAVNEDGSEAIVPSLNQRTAGGPVPRANLAGMRRHERVEALGKELAELDARRESLARQIERESDAIQQEQAQSAALDAEREGARH